MKLYRILLAGSFAAAGLARASSTAWSEEGKAAKGPEREGGSALPQIPASLDEMLAVALRSNPDILEAEAAVRQAQAKLNQARLKVIEEVLTAYHEKEKQEALVKSHLESLDTLRKRAAVGTASTDDMVLPQISLAEAQARLAQGRAHLRYLLGLGGDAGLGAQEKAVPREEGARTRPPLPERYRKLLEKKVSVDFTNTPLSAAIAKLEGPLGQKLMTRNIPGCGVQESFEDVPLRVVLETVADLCGICFIFRDYGVLATTPDHAATIYAPAFPEETPFGAK